MQDTSYTGRGFVKNEELEAAVKDARKVVTTWSKRRDIPVVTTVAKEFKEATGLEELPELEFGGTCVYEAADKRKDEKAFVYFDPKAIEDPQAQLVGFTHALTHALTGMTTGHNYTWRRQHVRVLVAVGLALGHDEDAILELAGKVAELNVQEFYNHWDREEDEEIVWLKDEAEKAARRVRPLSDEDEAMIEELASKS